MTKRVILDTNVLLSRLLLPDSKTARVVRRFLDRAQPIVSEDALRELAETLSRPKFDPYVSPPDRQRFFELFARVAEWVPVTTPIRRCRDPKDDKFLELAVDGKADWIITGDKGPVGAVAVSINVNSESVGGAGLAGYRILVNARATICFARLELTMSR